jgi:CheY-like chemotaxis protein
MMTRSSARWCASSLDHSPIATVIADADGSPDAVAAACAQGPDVVLLDQKLGGRLGTELIGDIVRVCPNAMIAIFSALDADIEEAPRAQRRCVRVLREARHHASPSRDHRPRPCAVSPGACGRGRVRTLGCATSTGAEPTSRRRATAEWSAAFIGHGLFASPVAWVAAAPVSRRRSRRAIARRSRPEACPRSDCWSSSSACKSARTAESSVRSSSVTSTPTPRQ